MRAPIADKGDALSVLGLLVLAEGAVRCLPTQLAARLFGVSFGAQREERSPAGPMTELESEVVVAARRVDRVVSVVHPKDGCLRRSLVLGHRLRERSPQLVIGVAKEDGALSAHAWLEIEGCPVPEPGGQGLSERFVRLRPTG
jgi:hypothetical protein